MGFNGREALKGGTNVDRSDSMFRNHSPVRGDLSEQIRLKISGFEIDEVVPAMLGAAIRGGRYRTR
jgi:hypothetical protein